MLVIKTPLNTGALDRRVGIEFAPEKILSFVKDFFINESGMLPVINVDGIDINNSDIGKSHENIFEKIKEVDDFSIILGGDHSLTFSSFKAFSTKFRNQGIVVFDSHPDLEKKERNFEPTHEDYLRALIEERILKKENIIIVGIRNWTLDELDFIRKNNIKVFSMKEISKEGLSEVCDSVMSVARTWDGLYVSVDIDVVDPAFAPGTGYTEPGGLTSRELILFLHKLKLLKNFRMGDIVEVNPAKDVSDVTSKLAAKLLVELS